MEKALFWIENMYFSWFEVENTLFITDMQPLRGEILCRAHAKKMSWEAIWLKSCKKKKNIAMLGQPAVELMSLSS